MSNIFTNFEGIRIFTEETTLNDKVKTSLDAGLFESCKQMRLYMIHSLQDIKNTSKIYNLSCRKFINLWHELIGVSLDSEEITGNCLRVNSKDWKKRFEKRLADYPEVFFVNTGVRIIHKDDYVEISNSLYPNMFFAMRSLLDISRSLEEKIDISNSFYCCDFRILCSETESFDNELKKFTTKPNQKPIEKRKLEIEDIISNSYDGEMKENLLDFIIYLRNNKLNPARSSASTWKISLKACVVCYLRYDSDAKTITIHPIIGEYGHDCLSGKLKEIVWTNTKKKKDCHGSCRCSYKLKTIFGRASGIYTCGNAIDFINPNAHEIECIKKLLELRKHTIQNGKLLPNLPRNFG